MNTENGLIHAILLDGKGGGKSLDWAGIGEWTPEQGILWIHLDYTDARVVEWLNQESGLEPMVADALDDRETRPRCIPVDDGLLINLRGVNTNPGAEAEDMVSIRLYATESRVISLRRRRLLTAADLAEALQKGKGPKTSGELTAQIADRLIERMSGVISELEDKIDLLEEQIILGAGQEARSGLLELRREIIMLRRYLSPQREALNQLYRTEIGWMSKANRLLVREAADALSRYVEELDSARDRAGIAYEELSNRLAEQMNSRMYVLSIVAGIFLPLGFLTGLLGVNVGGIPLAENPWGFAGVTLFMVVITFLQVLYFRRKHWI
jgi:zinc transporter